MTRRGHRRPLAQGSFASGAPTITRTWKHTSSVPAPAPLGASAATRSKTDLLAFVDQYDGIGVEEHLEILRDPYMRKYARPETPKLRVTNRPSDYDSPRPDEVDTGGREVQEVVTRLRAALLSRWRRPHVMDLDTIYNYYCDVPKPRIGFLTGRLRHLLLAMLGTTERKNTKSMLRYFAVVSDVKACGYALSASEWTTSLSFASRYVGTSTEVEAEAALRLWREMEHDGGIKGNEVTFNVLFDVASKAGKFKLAEMMYQEMKARGFHFNRYHHVSLIHFFGLQMNSSGVRAAYREMVEAGEMIDTTVLNCVMVGLLRCGEESSAEYVYEKMKAAQARSSIIPERNYRLKRNITKALMMFARIGRKYPQLRPGFQATALMMPDLHTYRILVNHFGVRLGSMSTLARLLDEMKFFRVPLHGAVFLAIFKGFSVHGALSSGTESEPDWSLERLEGVWTAFLDAIDDGAEGLYIDTWMSMWALRAFARCSNSRPRVLQVYEDLSKRWGLDEANTSFMMTFLHKLQKNLFRKTQRSW